MNDIESLLRQAPRPTPPPELRQRLQADIRLEPARAREPAPQLTEPSWWRRWVPALAFGLLFLGCFIVLAVQTNQYLQLRKQNEALRAAASQVEALQNENDRLRQLQPTSRQIEQTAQELQALRNEVTRLQPLVEQVSTARAENKRLQAATAQTNPAPADATDDPFAAQNARAQSVACISNLKQIGLAGRMWANEHNTDILPTDVLAMRQELPNPRVLTCPAEIGKSRTPMISWEQFDSASISYEFPSRSPNEAEPNMVYTRCPVHGHLGLCDGSGHSGDREPRLYTVLENGNLMLRRRPETK